VLTRPPLPIDQAGDMTEYRAIRSVFKSDAVRMNSTKSMIGHLMGAAGAVEAVATIKALQTGWIHPTINLVTPDEGVDLKIVTAGSKEHLPHMDIALSNSFGFGGHNSCVLFAKAPLS
jgi:3-oxoacyl-[acyl-carrier-protein] synthase II